MVDYQKMYHKLFNAITDAGKLMDKAAIIMKAAQIECEDIYTDTDDTPNIRQDNPTTQDHS